MEDLISVKDPTTPGSSLVALQPEGSMPKTYLVHGMAGHLLRFQSLSRYMAPDFPIYGLQAKGLNNEEELSQTIEEMGAAYIHEIQVHQPEGPYYVVGFSFGAYVAFEMARQLDAGGQQVALLVILDAPASMVPRYLESLNRTQHLIYQVRKLVLKSKIKVKPRFYIRSRVRRILGNNRPTKGIRPGTPSIPNDEGLAADHPEKVLDPDKAMKEEIESASPWQSIIDNNISALHKYAIHPYPGKITLFKAERGFRRVVYGWEPMAGGGVEIYSIPGNHLTIFEEPHVQVLAQKLKDCIARSIRS